MEPSPLCLWMPCSLNYSILLQRKSLLYYVACCLCWKNMVWIDWRSSTDFLYRRNPYGQGCYIICRCRFTVFCLLCKYKMPGQCEICAKVLDNSVFFLFNLYRLGSLPFPLFSYLPNSSLRRDVSMGQISRQWGPSSVRRYERLSRQLQCETIPDKLKLRRHFGKNSMTSRMRKCSSISKA